MIVNKEIEAKCLELASSGASDVLRRAIEGDGQSESMFQGELIAFAKRHGWLVYHTHNSKRSTAGYPDLTLVRGERLLFVELKTNTGKVSADQQRWLDAINQAGATACLWRPKDWPMIFRELS